MLRSSLQLCLVLLLLYFTLIKMTTSFPLLSQQSLSNYPILCFHNVQNATNIRTKLNELSSTTDNTQNPTQGLFKRLAIADLSNVVSAFHLQLAAYKTLQNEHQGSMKAKSSVVSEFLYHVSPTSKITDGIDNTRIQNDSTEIAFVYIPPLPIASSSSSSATTTSGMYGFVMICCSVLSYT